MKSSDIRAGFLRFFEERGHRIVPSASVIPHGDPTLLFTNAGMNQFKDVFLGTGTRDYKRAADTQKCIRVSGKHNDLEEVGRDTYHHTFFEMLGNWSFGDYYKEEAITWAWELLTSVWGLEKARLYATVFESDDESAELWKSHTDIHPSHIIRFGKKDNFWEMGETGPCGPCSEIHIDLTSDRSGGTLVNAGDPRVMEIWNLVFIQNNRKKDGSLEPLPARHVDTGMGFERVSAVLQHQRSNYDTDVFTPIIERIADVSGRPYQGETSQVAMRVIADHVRMLSFSIADGAIPGNEGRGYVLRRILRRASRFGRNLGIREPFLFRIPEAVAATMGSVFPEISEKRLHIERIIKAEEESFNATLDRGLEIFSSVLQKNQDTKTFPGEEAFRLYDTYGFPLDLTELMAQERGLTVDVTAFSALMEEQRRRARDSGKMVAADVNTILTRLGDLRDTTFVGYTQLEAHTSIREVIDGKYVSLDQSPFYVESGGQVDDTGIIRGKGFVGEVLNSLKRDKKVVHEIRIVEGKPVPGDAVDAIVDKESRLSTQRNHSATHLLHEALRRVLGTHLRQHGSLVAPDRLRFDFNHFERISREQMRAIEEIVNGKIADKIPILALNEPDQWLTIDEARARYPNVKMFFGDKYGDKVRIVEIDPAFSVELCGGTHSANTQDIQLFKIMSESSISSGIRRIEAVTGDGVRKYIEDLGQKVGTMDEEVVRLQEEKDLLEHTLGLSPPTTSVQRERVAITSFPLTIQSLDLLERSIADRQEIVGGLQKDLKELQKQVSRSRVTNAASGIDSLLDSATKLDGIVLAQGRVQASDMEELKSMGDALRLKLQGGVGILGSVIDDKASFVCVVTDDVIKSRGISAGAIVGALAKIVGGGGGGRPHLATAGGKDVSKIDEALAKSESILGDLLRRPPSKP